MQFIGQIARAGVMAIQLKSQKAKNIILRFLWLDSPPLAEYSESFTRLTSQYLQQEQCVNTISSPASSCSHNCELNWRIADIRNSFTSSWHSSNGYTQSTPSLELGIQYIYKNYWTRKEGVE